MMIMMIFIFGALIVLGLIVGFIYLLDYRAQRRYEQENTSRMINYIETHNIIDSLSPYFKNYTFRHQIDRSYYDFEDSLKKDIDRIIAVYGKQYNFNCYSQDLYQAMKKLISFYREQLLKNYHLGKDKGYLEAPSERSTVTLR